MTRLPAVAAAMLLALAGSAFSLAAPATAAPASSCSTSKGVLVVVDFRSFGGNITRGCDPTPTTGREALDTAGFQTQDVSRQPGFVCRIDGDPSDDPCVNTPPASQYWSYWHADKGQSNWTYSKVGASSSHPGDGSIDAWVFGATNTGGTSGGPCFTPADARAGRASGCAAAPAPKPKSKQSSAEAGSQPARHARHGSAAPGARVAPGSTTQSGSASNSAPAGAGGNRSSSGSASSGASSASAGSSSTSPTSDPDQAAPAIVDATAASSAQQGSGHGSVLSVVLGVALFVLLGAGAGWTALRRRRSDTGA